ncbi:D-alanyl-D-alanine carboxypeptidase-like protein [Sphingomonas sp. PP-F2F-G114-C0414]|uniref:M15 family metallopeptidase n=1 Tax=Sphingomonas sp. PP-F2F-G114-C0414 TaxID=2135662 RepID=UPI000EF91594|nr:M15 family metallopeptidase [Sphingomonas sp. PP-F2F-G114-C0414]RMB35589.1 D-alanyl-D-alanine carboxypeptidase-like protein [Sphingomonas sp. PP-F2F-G114-C0414]
MAQLQGSVGLHGLNRKVDVTHVQEALRASGHSPGPIDGLCGRRTIGAIVAAQQRLLARPDGLVEVLGPTWRSLSRPAATVASRAAPAIANRTAASHGAGSAASQAPSASQAPAAPPTSSRGLRYTDHLPLPTRGSVNVGIRSPSNHAVIARLGTPRESFTQDCQPPTNQAFKKLVVTTDVGPFRVTGLRPAVESLAAIFLEVRRLHPDLHTRLGTAGMMCCRNVRGSSRSISNHAWGTAIDMKIDGELVPRKARHVNLGLQLLAPIFNRHGWYWGATFSTPDPHHFECGADLLATFHA